MARRPLTINRPVSVPSLEDELGFVCTASIQAEQLESLSLPRLVGTYTGYELKNFIVEINSENRDQRRDWMAPNSSAEGGWITHCWNAGELKNMTLSCPPGKRPLSSTSLSGELKTLRSKKCSGVDTPYKPGAAWHDLDGAIPVQPTTGTRPHRRRAGVCCYGCSRARSPGD